MDSRHPTTGRLPLILASQSPRRSAILRDAGYAFEARPSGVDEEGAILPSDPAEYARWLARLKAEDVARTVAGDAFVVGADTVVVCDGDILTKPADDADALRMLETLRGRTHQVITGLVVLLVRDGRVLRRETAHETTEVTMRSASREDLAAYVATGEPRDKAGAYAIQGGAAALVESIAGDYLNVVGLPLVRLEALLRAVAR